MLRPSADRELQPQKARCHLTRWKECSAHVARSLSSLEFGELSSTKCFLREVIKKQGQEEIEKNSHIPGVKEGMSSAGNQSDWAWLKCQKVGRGGAREKIGVRAESGGSARWTQKGATQPLAPPGLPSWRNRICLTCPESLGGLEYRTL